ncbi:DUF977 family protein [Klebsiella pneumoniae]
MTRRTQLQKVRDVRKIIDFVKEHGRITTEQVAEMTGLSIKTARLDMQVAQRTGEIIRYGLQGLFRDLRATINFDLANYDSRKNAGGCVENCMAEETQMEFTKNLERMGTGSLISKCVCCSRANST